MSDQEFQSEIFRRLNNLEQGQARTNTLLSERCPLRKETLLDHEKRLKTLESSEERRKGGWVALSGLLLAASGLGGVVAKLLPFGGGQ